MKKWREGYLKAELTLRQKAEALLEEKQSKIDSTRSESDILRLVQESELHQIELELQNEELLLAKEQAIKATKEYIGLYDLAPSGYITLSSEGEIIKLNSSGAKMLGKNPSKLIGGLFGFYVTDKTKPLFNLFLTEVFSSKINQSCEITLSSNGDRLVHVHLDGIVNEDGSQCLMTLIDITREKMSEEALKSSNDQLSFLVREMQVGVLLQGPKAEMLMSNRKALELLGLSEDQLLGLSSFSPEWNVIHEDGSLFPGQTHPVPQSIKTKKPVIDVVMGVYRPETNNRVWLLVSAVPQLNSDGNIKQVVCTFIDISKRKRAELDLIEAKERADESEFFLKESQDVGNIGSYKTDFIAGKWKSSEALDRIFGIDKGYDRNIGGWLDIIHPEERNNINDYLNNEVVGKRMPFNKEYRIVRINDKQTRWVHGIGATTFDSLGNITEMIGTIQDITDRKFAEIELHLAKEKAEENDRLKSAFLANMSHEIRTPMNGILGFAELLKEPDLKSDEQQEYITIIEKSGARMLNIINDIVDISKIESGLMKLDIKESNINKQIEYIYTFFKPEVEAKGINLSFKNPLPVKEATFTTDREKFYAILTNLVKNAIKYTKKGEIELGYYKKGEIIEFYVKDTGIGIPKDRQEAIFERFIQADIADKMALQGAGLGLSISKAYVEMLGGKIWVESEEGIGSTFYFNLPYIAEPEERKVVGKSVPAQEEKNQIKKLKILIVEDDEISEMLISRNVEQIGKDILKSWSGSEAVEVCRNNPDIDLILMDIQIPIMNGYEATKQIREFNKDVIIIAQTAFALSGNREDAISAGCTDYISKPIKKDELVSMIQKYFKEQ